MSAEKYLHIVDENVKRRAELVRMALSQGYQCTVFDTLQDCFATRPDTGLVLLHDDAQPTAFRHLTAMLARSGRWIGAGGYADNPNLTWAIEAVRFGALSFFATPGSAADLQAALNVLGAECERQRRSREKGLKAFISLSKLTKREWQILDYVMEGYNSRDIAQLLPITYRTVEIHRYNMLKKIDALNAADAVRIRFEADVYIKTFLSESDI